MEKRQSFIYGTFILLCANILVKIIGAIFKIPLTNLIGASGMGTFSVAYNLYVIMFSVSTAGLPVAISKLVSEANATNKSSDVPRIIKCAFVVFFGISLILTILVLVFAGEICNLISNQSSYFSILAVAPSIFLITIVSILRGYYQGHHNMTKTAVSQIIEALFKLLVGYFFADYLIKVGYSVEIASAGAIFGVTFGTFLSAIYLCVNILFFRKKYTKKPVTSYKKIRQNLFQIAIPITLGTLMLSLTSLVDMFTIMNRLTSIGISENLANDLYGAYNMSLTLYNLPQTIVMAISVSIIPILSENYIKKNYINVKKMLNSALFIAVLIALPCSVGFITLSEEILSFLYYKRPEDVIMAAPILVILGVSVVFVSITSIINASMQAMGKPLLPIKAISVGILVKLVVNFVTLANPSINISGAAMGSACCFFVIAVLNVREIRKLTSSSIDMGKIFIRPLIASILMGLTLTQISENLTGRFAVLMLIAIGGAVYFLVLIIIGGFNSKDLALITKKE